MAAENFSYLFLHCLYATALWDWDSVTFGLRLDLSGDVVSLFMHAVQGPLSSQVSNLLKVALILLFYAICVSGISLFSKCFHSCPSGFSFYPDWFKMLIIYSIVLFETRWGIFYFYKNTVSWLVLQKLLGLCLFFGLCQMQDGESLILMVLQMVLLDMLGVVIFFALVEGLLRVASLFLWVSDMLSR